MFLSNSLRLFRQHIFFTVALLTAFFLYATGISFPYISWDDPEMVFRNTDVKHLNFFSFFSRQYVGNYIPLTMLVHSLNFILFGEYTWGHHLVSILVHLANGLLVYLLCITLFDKKNIAFCAGAIFLLHPLQVESVSWIAEFKTLGYSLFFLLGLYVYTSQLLYQRKAKWWVLPLLFIISCLFKPAAVVFPLALLSIDVFVKREFNVGMLLNKIPLFAISLLFGLINIKTQAAAQFINYAHQFTLHQKFLNAGYAIYSYLYLFLVPVKLSIIYPFPDTDVLKKIIGIAVWLILFAVSIYFYRKKKFNWFWPILFVFLNLLLVLQFVPFGEVLYADRYMYLPLMGLGVLCALLFDKINLKIPFIAITVSFILSGFTFMRIQKWKNSITLFEDIIKKYPDNFLALNSLGVEYMMKNNNDKALLYFNRAIESAPNNYKSYYNRALLYLKNNQPKAAIKDLDKTLGIYDYHKAYIARASSYYALMDYDKARIDAKTALFKDSKNAKAYFILGNCENDQNKLQSAVELYSRAIELNKDEPDFYFKRSIALGKQQNFMECISDLNTTLKLNANYTEAYYWRAVAKVNLNENPCEDFKRAAQGGYQIAQSAFQKYCGN